MTSAFQPTAKVTPINSVAAGNSALPSPAMSPPRQAPVTSQPVRSRVSLRSRLTQAVPFAQYYLVTVGPAGIAGVVATVTAIVMGVAAFVGGHNATDSYTAEMGRLHKSGQPAGTDAVIGRVVSAFPQRDQIPVVIAQMVEQARLAGVALDSGHYAYSPPGAGGVGRYEIQFPIKAEYPAVRDFLDRTLTALPAVGLDKLRIERKAVGDSLVSADVSFVVFFRAAADP